jgi:hypothetical protein
MPSEVVSSGVCRWRRYRAPSREMAYPTVDQPPSPVSTAGPLPAASRPRKGASCPFRLDPSVSFSSSKPAGGIAVARSNAKPLAISACRSSGRRERSEPRSSAALNRKRIYRRILAVSRQYQGRFKALRAQKGRAGSMSHCIRRSQGRWRMAGRSSRCDRTCCGAPPHMVLAGGHVPNFEHGCRGIVPRQGGGGQG